MKLPTAKERYCDDFAISNKSCEDKYLADEFEETQHHYKLD